MHSAYCLTPLALVRSSSEPVKSAACAPSYASSRTASSNRIACRVDFPAIVSAAQEVRMHVCRRESNVAELAPPKVLVPYLHSCHQMVCWQWGMLMGCRAL